MKRILSLLLTLCLAAALAVPALAETATGDDMEAALQTITARVKDVLEIDDDYTDFSGNFNDGLRPGWYLYWSDDERELSVTCDEAGVVTDAYFWANRGQRDSFYGFDAAFPALEENEARAQAEAWLSRLMGEGETARIDGYTLGLTRDGAYRFYGAVLMDGLESPVTFNLRLNGDGLSSYDRSDGYSGYVGAIPAAEPAVPEADAAPALADAVALELYYVSDGDGGARLRYVPAGPYTVVDAQSGETVDMDALYASFGGTPGVNGREMPMAEESASAADSAGGRGLTEVELSSIAGYRDVLSQEALDKTVRALPSLGLEDFALARCSYAMDSEGNVTANLRYSCEMTANNLFGFPRSAYEDYITWGETPIVYKYLALDARTGALISLSTSYPLWDGDRTAAAAPSSAAAEGFLQAAAPEKLAESALCTLKGYEERRGMTFARLHDGYFFPENYLSVEMNAAGTVDAFRFVWDDDVTFAPSRGIVDEAAAKAAYIGALDVTLGYVAWPEDIDYDDPALYRYADWGYTFVESLRLGYYYGGTADIAGVDALTGEPVIDADGGTFTYDDLAGESRRESIEALAAVGIGFAGGVFRPGDALTMQDGAVLLLQAAGYSVTDWDDDMLRQEAQWMGFVTAGQWQPDKVLSRMDFLRMLLGASRYGPAMELEGIWRTTMVHAYRTNAGCASIAQALGMLEGIGPLSAACTRADGAELLYRFMGR